MNFSLPSGALAPYALIAFRPGGRLSTTIERLKRKAEMKTITLNKGGTDEKTIPVSQLVIPDLWKIAQIPELQGYSIGGRPVKDLIIDCWHIAHNLKRAIEEQN